MFPTLRHSERNNRAEYPGHHCLKVCRTATESFAGPDLVKAASGNSAVEPFKLKSKMDQHGLDDHDKIISALPRSLELRLLGPMKQENSTASFVPETAASPVKAT